MPKLEINLGEFLGKIVIERKKSRSRILSDLGRDLPAIEGAIRKNARNKDLVQGGDYIGDENFVPAKILITSLNTRDLLGSPMVRYLYIDLEGKLIEEYNVTNYDKTTSGMHNRETSPDELPSWVSEAITEVELKARVDRLFYPDQK